MKTKTKLWRGLSAVMAFLLMVAIFASQVANQNAGGINNFLGITAANSTSTGTAEGEALYTSDYGELSDENLAKLIEDEMAYCVSQMEEG
jgi:hypothetical protein